MEQHESTPADRVQHAPAFMELAHRRTVFVASGAIASFALIMSWLVLAAFTTALDEPVIGGMTWAYLLGYILFAVALAVLHLYLRRAAEWDRLASRARREFADRGPSA